MSPDPNPAPSPPVALTIAGFDPSSGAGVTADLQVFAAHGVFGTAALSALTVQSTRGVWDVQPVDSRFLADTLQRLDEDLPAAGIKIGMLGTAAVVATVSAFLEEARRRRQLTVVLDPVLQSSSGANLLHPDAFDEMRQRLLPLCDCVTPNRAEMNALLGDGAESEPEIAEAARRLQTWVGGAQVVVTGGDGKAADDLVLSRSGELVWLRASRIDSSGTHGTGCAFSSGLLCGLIGGQSLLSAAERAKAYVRGAIETAPRLGSGKGPLHHLWPLRLRQNVVFGESD